MHVEEVDRDRESKDESQRHIEGGQRQACTWKRWTETDRRWMTGRDIWRVDRDRQRKDAVRDIWRVDRDRHAEECIRTDTVDKVDIHTVVKDDTMLMNINSRHDESFSL